MTATNAHAQLTLQDRERHRVMVELVFDWMRRTHASQQRLVQAINEFWHRRGKRDYQCDHTLLSRILNPDRPHVPTPHRPRSMMILQAAMIVCARNDDPNLIAQANDEDRHWASDDEHLFKVHRARLRHLRNHQRQSLFTALSLVGEFVAAAASMSDLPVGQDESFRVRGVENTLMTLAALCDDGQSLRDVAERLREEGCDEVTATQTMQQQVARLERLLESLPTPSVNMNAYAGAGLFFCGQQERGMTLLLAAVERSEDLRQRHDPHWETLLELLNRLLIAKHAHAPRWTRQAAQLAQRALKHAGKAGLLRAAWNNLDAAEVRTLWSAIDANLVTMLDTAAPTTPATPRKPAILRAVAAVGLALLALLGAPALSIAATDDSDLRLAIRGREASSPTPPPPPSYGGPSTTV